MNTSLLNREPQLLVDIENGRVLRGDDSPQVTHRWLNSHPFIAAADNRRAFFAGPDAARAAACHDRGEATRHLDALQYEVQDDLGGYVRLQRVIEE